MLPLTPRSPGWRGWSRTNTFPVQSRKGYRYLTRHLTFWSCEKLNAFLSVPDVLASLGCCSRCIHNQDSCPAYIQEIQSPLSRSCTVCTSTVPWNPAVGLYEAAAQLHCYKTGARKLCCPNPKTGIRRCATTLSYAPYSSRLPTQFFVRIGSICLHPIAEEDRTEPSSAIFQSPFPAASQAVLPSPHSPLCPCR